MKTAVKNAELFDPGDLHGVFFRAVLGQRNASRFFPGHIRFTEAETCQSQANQATTFVEVEAILVGSCALRIDRNAVGRVKKTLKLAFRQPVGVREGRDLALLVHVRRRHQVDVVWTGRRTACDKQATKTG